MSDNDYFPSGISILAEGTVPLRSFSEDAIDESEKMLSEKIYDSEERLKRHITECKHELIKAMMSIMKHERQIENKLKENEPCLAPKRKLKKNSTNP